MYLLKLFKSINQPKIKIYQNNKLMLFFNSIKKKLEIKNL
jgi:hypothetical protein